MKKAIALSIIIVLVSLFVVFAPVAAGVLALLSKAQAVYNGWWGAWIESAMWSIGLPGTLFALLVRHLKYRGVSLVAVKGGSEIGRKGIEPRKAQSMAGDEWERTLTLKGFASTYGWLNIDVLEISRFDAKSKSWIVDFDRNPASKPKGPGDAEKVIAWIEKNCPAIMEKALVAALETDSSRAKKADKK